MKHDQEVKRLVAQLEALSVEATSPTNPQANFSALIKGLGKHAQILFLLSREADLQSRRMLALTWVLVVLTVVLTAFALIQVAPLLR